MDEHPGQTSDTPPPGGADVYRITFSGIVDAFTVDGDGVAWVRIVHRDVFAGDAVLTMDAHLEEFHKRDLDPDLGLHVTLTLAFWDDGETRWHYLERLSVP